jgi:carboxymethylenebutenolidase
MRRLTLAIASLGLLSTALTALAQGYVPFENPVGETAWWWEPGWWEEGQLDLPVNHPVATRWIEYESIDATVPALIARPADDRRYPAVLYQHGRRGLDELVQRQVKRIAARGFVVLAPDVFTARFIEKFPIEHDYAVEDDVNAGLDVLLGLPDVSTDEACLVSHTRGGYMTLKVAVTQSRQDDVVACFASYYPHMQDPNAPEPMQVYRYAPEADDLTVPVLIFIGDQEQYQRRRSIETAVEALRAKDRPVRLVVYPGVGRGFDFRPPTVRTFADDLASKDAIMRLADFLRAHLHPDSKTNRD